MYSNTKLFYSLTCTLFFIVVSFAEINIRGFYIIYILYYTKYTIIDV